MTTAQATIDVSLATTLDAKMAMEIIELLEFAKHEHHRERDGIMDCASLSPHGAECDCGASAVNERLDAMQQRLYDRFGIERGMAK